MAQVRAGVRRNGPWNVEVAAAGEYEIALRRWPAEFDAAALEPAEINRTIRMLMSQGHGTIVVKTAQR